MTVHFDEQDGCTDLALAYCYRRGRRKPETLLQCVARVLRGRPVSYEWHRLPQWDLRLFPRLGEQEKSRITDTPDPTREGGGGGETGR